MLKGCFLLVYVLIVADPILCGSGIAKLYEQIFSINSQVNSLVGRNLLTDSNSTVHEMLVENDILPEFCYNLDSNKTELLNQDIGNASLVLNNIRNTTLFEGKWISNNKIPFVNEMKGEIVMHLQSLNWKHANITYDYIKFSVLLIDENSNHDNWVLIQEDYNKEDCSFKNLTYNYENGSINFHLKGNFLGIFFLEVSEAVDSNFYFELVPQYNENIVQLQEQKLLDSGISNSTMNEMINSTTSELEVIGLTGSINFMINSVQYEISTYLTKQNEVMLKYEVYTGWTNTMAIIILITNAYLVIYFKAINEADAKFVSF